MNAKQLFALSALVLASASSFAAEGEQWVSTSQGVLTRAEVKAELARAQAAGEVATTSATYGAFESKSNRVASKPVEQRNRDDVRATVGNTFSSLYVGG